MISKILHSRPLALNFKSLSWSLEQFFLTVGQNNFGNKIPYVPLTQIITKLFVLGVIQFLMKPRNYLGHNTYCQLFVKPMQRKRIAVQIKSFYNFVVCRSTKACDLSLFWNSWQSTITENKVHNGIFRQSRTMSCPTSN